MNIFNPGTQLRNGSVPNRSKIQGISNAVHERNESGKITKQIINQQLGLAPTTAHFKIQFQPNQNNHPVSNDLAQLQQSITSKPVIGTNPYLENNPYPIYRNMQNRSLPMNENNISKLPPQYDYKNRDDSSHLKNISKPMNGNYHQELGIYTNNHSHSFQTAKFTNQIVSPNQNSNPVAATESRKVKAYIPYDDDEDEPKHHPIRPVQKYSLQDPADFYSYGDDKDNLFDKSSDRHQARSRQPNVNLLNKKIQNEPKVMKSMLLGPNEIRAPTHDPISSKRSPKEDFARSDSTNMFLRGKKKEEESPGLRKSHGESDVRYSPGRNLNKLKTAGESNQAFVSDGASKRYNLKEFKEFQEATVKQRLGGLGPNTGTEEWARRKERLEKMIEFAKSANFYNVTKPPQEKIEQPKPRKTKVDEEREKAKAARERALEFAKHIPRPTIKKADDSDVDDDDKVEKIREKIDYHELKTDSFKKEVQNPVLAEFERQHQQHQEQIRRIKFG